MSFRYSVYMLRNSYLDVAMNALTELGVHLVHLHVHGITDVYACHPHLDLFHRSPLRSKGLAFMIKRPLRYKHQHDITQTSLKFKAARNR